MSERAQLESVYERWAPMVRRRCASLLGGDHEEARDVAHDVFVRYAKAARRRPIEKPSAFLWRTATNTCLNVRAKRSGREPAAPPELVDQIAQIAQSADALSARSTLRSLFSGRSERDRYVAALYHIDGMTHAEVAAEVGVSVTTVRNTLRSLRTELRALSEDEDRR